MNLMPRSTDVNYEAWMGLPVGLQSAWDAFNKTKQAKADAQAAQMELALKRQKLAGGGGDFNAPNYEAKLREELWSKTGGLESMKKSVESFSGLESAFKAGSDIAILYGFIKSLDPNSVVREGEVALTRLGVPALDDAARRLTNALKTGKTADLLTPALRKQFYGFAETDLANRARTYQEAESRIGGLASQYSGFGVDPSRVLPGGSYLKQENFTPSLWSKIQAPHQMGAGPAFGAQSPKNLTAEEAERARLKELEDRAAGRY